MSGLMSLCFRQNSWSTKHNENRLSDSCRETKAPPHGSLLRVLPCFMNDYEVQYLYLHFHEWASHLKVWRHMKCQTNTPDITRKIFSVCIDSHLFRSTSLFSLYALYIMSCLKVIMWAGPHSHLGHLKSSLTQQNVVPTLSKMEGDTLFHCWYLTPETAWLQGP